jgi:hypothetical protein
MSKEAERVCIHGREFQRISVDEKIYCVPIANDDAEEDRLTAQHALFCRLLGNALVPPMIRLRDPTKVLDCGYGGGDWSVQFAEEFEDCEVRSADASLHGFWSSASLLREAADDCRYLVSIYSPCEDFMYECV